MPELRKDPVMGRWVIISTERGKRPTDFARVEGPPAGDNCLFCENREQETPAEVYAIRRSGTHANSPGWYVRVVPSSRPVLRIEGEVARRGVGLYDKMRGVGAHEVVLESPRHVTHFDMLELEQMDRVWDAYKHRIADLKGDKRFRYIMVFKNQGSESAQGSRHVHSQVIALPVTPKRVHSELAGFKRYFDYKERCLFCDLLQQELELDARIVEQNDSFVVWAPFAARFSFEMWVIPRRHDVDFESITEVERRDLSAAMRSILAKVRLGLDDPPFNYVIHTGPNRSAPSRSSYWQTIEKDFHWHMEIMPRLAGLGGFEWGSGFYINHVSPEEVAEFMRGYSIAGQ